jgi:hypothetical protein
MTWPLHRGDPRLAADAPKLQRTPAKGPHEPDQRGAMKSLSRTERFTFDSEGERVVGNLFLHLGQERLEVASVGVQAELFRRADGRSRKRAETRAPHHHEQRAVESGRVADVVPHVDGVRSEVRAPFLRLDVGEDPGGPPYRTRFRMAEQASFPDSEAAAIPCTAERIPPRTAPSRANPIRGPSRYSILAFRPRIHWP